MAIIWNVCFKNMICGSKLQKLKMDNKHVQQSPNFYDVKYQNFTQLLLFYPVQPVPLTCNTFQLTSQNKITSLQYSLSLSLPQKYPLSHLSASFYLFSSCKVAPLISAYGANNISYIKSNREMSDLQSWQSFLQLNNPNFQRSSKWSEQLFLIESSFNYFPSEGQGEYVHSVYQVEIPDEDSSVKYVSSLGSTFLKEDASDKIQEFHEKKSKEQVKKKTGCKCKKSFCLKSYCDCYSSGGFCSPDCGCLGCKNTSSNTEAVKLSRQNKKPLRSKTGHFCNCKKSMCSKNYCQCFHAGVPCGQHCSCSGCDNCEKKERLLDGEASCLKVDVE